MVARPTKEDALFGKRVELIRKIRNISRKVVAGKLGISPQQYSKYEWGQDRISVGRLYTIAKALGVGVQELVPPQLDSSHPIFKGQADSMAAHMWSKLNKEQKRSMISIMRELLR